MTSAGDRETRRGLVGAVLSELEAVGFTISPTSDGYVVRSDRGDLPLEPHLVVSEELLNERLTIEAGDDAEARARALSLLTLLFVETLTTDHGGGVTYVRALGYRRGPGGNVEFFVEEDVPPVENREPSSDLRWEA